MALCTMRLRKQRSRHDVTWCTVPSSWSPSIFQLAFFLFVSLNILVIVSGVLEGPNAFSHLLGLCLSLVRYFEEHCRPLKRWMAWWLARRQFRQEMHFYNISKWPSKWYRRSTDGSDGHPRSAISRRGMTRVMTRRTSPTSMQGS